MSTNAAVVFVTLEVPFIDLKFDAIRRREYEKAAALSCDGEACGGHKLGLNISLALETTKTKTLRLFGKSMFLSVLPW